VKRETLSNLVRGKKKIVGSKFFVFCRKTGSKTQFQEEATDPNHVVERIAGALAVQCLVRGQNPEDFEVLVPVDSGLSGQMVTRARQLLQEGRAAASPPCLSPRQNEILHSVLRHQANKEIASRLNITVRTVKFHISSLLEKFGVENRAELARRATNFMEMNHFLPAPAGFSVSAERTVSGPANPPNYARGANPLDVRLRAADKALNLRFPGSALSA
jgi:DNA-binding CsgD family transcriptional regulator